MEKSQFDLLISCRLHVQRSAEMIFFHEYSIRYRRILTRHFNACHYALWKKKKLTGFGLNVSVKCSSFDCCSLDNLKK